MTTNTTTFAGIQIATSKKGRILLRSLAIALRGPLGPLVSCSHETTFDGMIDGSAAVSDGWMTAEQMASAVDRCTGKSHGGGCYVTHDGALRVYSYCDSYTIRIKTLADRICDAAAAV
jgi:hypothetical protein